MLFHILTQPIIQPVPCADALQITSAIMLFELMTICVLFLLYFNELRHRK